MTDNKWFSHAGSLDDSSDSSNTSNSTPVKSTVIDNNSIETRTANSADNSFIKPVKGLSNNSPDADCSLLETNNTDMYIAPVTTEARCRKCGAVVPKGSTLCWNCSESESVIDKTDSIKKKPMTTYSNSTLSVFSVKNILKTLSIICSILVFMPSFIVYSFEVGLLDVVSGRYNEYVEYAGGSANKIYPSLYLLIIIPIAIVVLLFIKNLVDNLKAIIIVCSVAVDLFFWYRFFSRVKTLAAYWLSHCDTTIWFILNITLLVTILIISVLILMHVLEMDTDIGAKISHSKMNEN